MLVAGVRWGGGTSVRDLKIAAGTTMDSDTSLAMYAGHQPSRRAIVAEAADGQSADRPLVTTSSTLPQVRPCGRPPAAAILGRLSFVPSLRLWGTLESWDANRAPAL